MYDFGGPQNLAIHLAQARLRCPVAGFLMVVIVEAAWVGNEIDELGEVVCLHEYLLLGLSGSPRAEALRAKLEIIRTERDARGTPGYKVIRCCWHCRVASGHNLVQLSQQSLTKIIERSSHRCIISLEC